MSQTPNHVAAFLSSRGWHETDKASGRWVENSEPYTDSMAWATAVSSQLAREAPKVMKSNGYA